MGLWFELPIPGPNRPWGDDFVSGLRRATAALGHYEHLAQALGYADRRNVQTSGEFEACGADLAALYSDARSPMPRWWRT